MRKHLLFAQVHAYIISHLKKEMPSMFGKEAKKKELINSLPQVYEQIQRQHLISLGDFPNLKRLQEQLEKEDFNKFHSMKPKLVEAVDEMLRTDVARLMAMIPREEQVISTEPAVKGGAFEVYNDSPFGIGKGEGKNNKLSQCTSSIGFVGLVGKY